MDEASGEDLDYKDRKNKNVLYDKTLVLQDRNQSDSDDDSEVDSEMEKIRKGKKKSKDKQEYMQTYVPG